MKKDHFEKLIRESGQSAKLSREEREKMRFVLREYMTFKPAVAKEAAEISSFRRGLEELLITLRRPALHALSAALMITLTGSGVALASEASLPGDALYPLKVAVTEPVRTFLTSAEEKARWHMALAERRLDEAALLARKGKLDEETEETLALRFSKSANLAVRAVEEEAVHDPESISLTSDRFANRLSAYENVLEKVEHESNATSTKLLRAAVRGRIESAGSIAFADKSAKVMVASFSLEEVSTSSEESSAALRLKAETDAILRSVADLIGSNEKILDEATESEARERLQKAEEFAAEGRELLDENDPGEAAKAFKRALKIAYRLDVLTRASIKLKVNAFSNSVDTRKDFGDNNEEDGRGEEDVGSRDETSDHNDGNAAREHGGGGSSAASAATKLLTSLPDDHTDARIDPFSRPLLSVEASDS